MKRTKMALAAIALLASIVCAGCRPWFGTGQDSGGHTVIFGGITIRF